MIIPYQDLAPDTLIQLIEQFVLQEGTEYGEYEISLAEKVLQVRRQLDSGVVVLVYSELHESVNIVPKEQVSEESNGMDT